MRIFSGEFELTSAAELAEISFFVAPAAGNTFSPQGPAVALRLSSDKTLTAENAEERQEELRSAAKSSQDEKNSDLGRTTNQPTRSILSWCWRRNSSHSARVKTPGVVPMERTQLAPRALA